MIPGKNKMIPKLASFLHKIILNCQIQKRKSRDELTLVHNLQNQNVQKSRNYAVFLSVSILYSKIGEENGKFIFKIGISIILKSNRHCAVILRIIIAAEFYPYNSHVYAYQL